MGNRNMHKAKKNKKDEFYTQIGDIEKEVLKYGDQFKDKIVYLNCDDPAYFDIDGKMEISEKGSNFWNFFYLQFEKLGLKKLIATHYDDEEPTYKLEYTGGGIENVIKTDLEQNGDFRSPESIEILKEADIVCTNPPFSLFREYVAQLVEHDKKFLIMGNNNAVTYKEIFPLIKDNKMWLGYHANKTMEFRLPEYYEKWDREDGNGNKYGKVPAISWFTNLELDKRNEDIFLYQTYKGNEDKYPKYDNYEAIEVGRVNNIPKDYQGVMGVPITFLTKYNPNQFKIIGLGTSREHYQPTKQYEGLKTISKTGKVSSGAPINSTLAIKINNPPKRKKYYMDKEGNYYLQPYARVLIKNKKPVDVEE